MGVFRLMIFRHTSLVCVRLNKRVKNFNVSIVLVAFLYSAHLD